MSDDKYLSDNPEGLYVSASAFDSNFHCEKLFSLMNKVQLTLGPRLADEHLEKCMQIALIFEDLKG